MLWLGGVVLPAIILGALALGGGSPASAANYLPLPAPAGTVWEIVGGYNTATHVGGDPYAIDIVRRDGETANTPLLSPVNGRVGYVSDDCLSVLPTEDVSILLCHVFVAPGLERGTEVTVGQPLGVVAPAGSANNNGLAHIHIGVHDQRDGFGDTVPFTGPFALEGQDLPPTGEANAYSGLQFTSTNVPGTLISNPPPAPTPEPTVGTITGGVVPEQGIGLIVFGGGSNEELVTASGCAEQTLSFWTTREGRFIGFIPAAAVPIVNVEWDETWPSGIPAGTPLAVRCR